MAKKKTAKQAGKGKDARTEIAWVELTRMNPAPYNPRKTLAPGDAEWERLVRSIDEFGYVEVMVWNRRTGHLVGGHQRYNVLRHRGVTRAQVSVVDLDEAREKALNLALNKVRGQWDQQALADLLNELGGLEDFDVTLTGFDEDECRRICEESARLMDQVILDQKDDEKAPAALDASPQLAEMQYRIIIECRDERQQRRLIERFESEGINYKAMIV